MKTICKPLLLLFYLLSSEANAQILSENFNAGFPVAWTQSPTATWTLNTVLNTPGNCIISHETGASSTTATIISPTLNVSAMIDFTISFKAAVTKNNFVAPEIVLSYDNGNSTQFLARWSSGFNPNTTYTVNEGFETQDSIGTEDVIWESCTHTIYALNGNIGRFTFTSEVLNGGWTLFDDIVIRGKPVNSPTLTTEVMETSAIDFLQVFPNPSRNGKVTVSGLKVKHFTVLDQLGRELTVESKQRSEDALELNFEDLIKGIYYLQIVSDNNESTFQKIILD